VCVCPTTHTHTHTVHTHTQTHTLHGQGVDYLGVDRVPEILFYASYDNSFSLANMGVFVGEDLFPCQYLFLLYSVVLLR
jgi:hypothetical protein